MEVYRLPNKDCMKGNAMGKYFDVRKGFGNDKENPFPDAPKAGSDPVDWGDYAVLTIQEAAALSFGASPLQIRDYLSNPHQCDLDDQDIFYDRVERIKRAMAGKEIRTGEPDPTTGEVRVFTEDVVNHFKEQARKVPQESQGELPCSCDTRLFDENYEYYPRELVIAIRAWQAVTRNPKRRMAAKALIRNWLKKEYPGKMLSEEARKRIATVCNWNKRGGATRTE
jgi:hypothetical protein